MALAAVSLAVESCAVVSSSHGEEISLSEPLLEHAQQNREAIMESNALRIY
jgi:hypothetical protein